MATNIKVAGKDLKLAYTLHAAVSYEKMTGHNALDLKQFDFGETGLIEPIIVIGYCMINASNPKSEVPEFEDYLNAINDFEITKELIAKVTQELFAFFKPTEADKAEKQEDAAKNA